jgi:hypothetical protein
MERVSHLNCGAEEGLQDCFGRRERNAPIVGTGGSLSGGTQLRYRSKVSLRASVLPSGIPLPPCDITNNISTTNRGNKASIAQR